jgi:hypothetical protein
MKAGSSARPITIYGAIGANFVISAWWWRVLHGTSRCERS